MRRSPPLGVSAVLAASALAVAMAAGPVSATEAGRRRRSPPARR
ncbi:hypothetical protein [Actinomadura madurae]|nr:hypothetical protein [Actinomadura madurae]